MVLRKISEKMILYTLLRPEKIRNGHSGKRVNFKEFADGIVKVVYTKENGQYIIISAIWHKKYA